MNLSRLYLAFLLMLPAAFSFGAACDFPLNTKVIDGKFSWVNKDLKDVVVLFDKAGENQYVVKGFYQLAADGKYRFLRNYLVEWPTFYGHEETFRVTKINFRQGKYNCVMDFIGKKSTPGAGEESAMAIYEVAKNGLIIQWAEANDLLKFSSVPISQIVP